MLPELLSASRNWGRLITSHLKTKLAHTIYILPFWDTVAYSGPPSCGSVLWLCLKFYPPCSCLLREEINSIQLTAKLAIFLQDILWESCLKLNFEQLSHSMFCKNIASLAVAMETCDPWILAKRAIFLQNILWESCSKFYFKHFCYNMFYLNIISLAVIMIIRF